MVECTNLYKSLCGTLGLGDLITQPTKSPRPKRPRGSRKSWTLTHAAVAERAHHGTAEEFGSRPRPYWELIIVDDGSNDCISSVLAPFLQDERIRLVRQSAMGAAAARNHRLK